MSLPDLTPSMNFAEASAAVVDFLETNLPMGLWTVTRYDGERQVYVEVRDAEYGVAAGATVDWDATMCKHMVAGTAPQLAPDVMAVPAYAEVALASDTAIGSYVGVPITRPGGEVFGTICGVDPERHDTEWEERRPTLNYLSRLLSSILEADLARTGQQRVLERAAIEAQPDALTGLPDRRGWDFTIELEEARYRRFADRAAVLVVDLDGLKQVNASSGHAAGDELIRLAATTIRSLVRAEDLVARLGDDEFGVLVSDATASDTETLAARLTAGLDEAGVAATIGYAPYTLSGGLPEAWRAADRAMNARKSGRLELAS